MNLLRTTWTVFRFECRRAFGLPRLAMVIGLALFPFGLLWLIQSRASHFERLERFDRWATVLFILIPEVVCLLALLLWATPGIHTEVEGKTWTYLVVRPGGRVPILLGKYLAAVIWTALTGILSLSMAIGMVAPTGAVGRGWLVFASLVLLACLTYGSVYVLLGVLFLRRGMMAAVAYTFFFEFLIGLVPAVINRCTVQYHLRTLMVQWLHISPPPRSVELIGSGPAWQHVAVLVSMSLGFLAVASWVVVRRELVTSTEV
jgi:ABC-type transport system involved in multi-copper enzyme maturation permease subunit